MVSINYSSREVCCKIVYYGPGLSGKTTNLQYVHSKVPSNTRGKMISLATEADRTLYFDFLPINIGTINGFAAKFQLYTVPGQVYYNATRKLVLRGVDGLVFVADSQPDKMEENIESLTNLEENLAEYGYSMETLPVVIQYNKRDLPGVLSMEELNQQLNPKGWPHFGASATIGNGVFDTLKMIIKIVLEKAKSNAATSAPKPVKVMSPEEGQPEPVGVGSGPLSQSGGLSSGEQQAGARAMREKQEPDSGYRPYPGSEGDSSAQPQPEPEPSAHATVSESESAVGEKPEEPRPETTKEHQPEDKAATAGQEAMVSEQRPMMAPSVRRRRETTKKRGFFKRLFGLK